MFWKKKNLRASIIVDKCDNCNCCVRICRHRALETVVVENKTVAFVNRPERCTGCGKCIKTCSNRAIELIERYF